MLATGTIRLSTLRIENWRLLFDAYSTVLHMTRLLKSGSYKVLLENPAASPRYLSRYDAARVGKAVSFAARLVPGATCLPQALSVQRMLGRRGMRAVVSVGVQDINGKLQGHAWIEDRGVVIVGGSKQQIDAYRLIAKLTLKGA